jgi:hypothetical protein
VIKLLASLLSLLDRIYAAWSDNKLKEQGRQEAIQEAKDDAEHQIALAAAVLAVSDSARDERLRSRFDRSHPAE